jgi:hypothetical protein
MTTDEILFIIDRHIQTSKGKGVATALEHVKTDIEKRIEAETALLNKPSGKCKICYKEVSRLHKGLYCIQCYDLYID